MSDEIYDRCILQIPFPNALANVQLGDDGLPTPESWAKFARDDFDNYKAIERRVNDASCCHCAPPFPSGPKVWYKAGSLTLSDGDPVDTWYDISGNDYHATQHLALPVPTYYSNIVNGEPAVLFDGNSAVSYETTAVGLQGPTLQWDAFAVFLTNDAATQQIIFDSDNQTNQPGTVRASQYLVLYLSDLDTVPEAAFNEFSGQGISASTWYIGEAWSSGTAAEALLDGVGDGATPYTAQTESPNGFYVGFHPNPTALFNGFIAEIIGWDRKLTDEERGWVMAYLQTTYGL